MSVEPPKIARRLLELTLPEDARSDILDDLDEVFRMRHRAHGRLRASLWYVREAVAFAVRFSAQGWHERERMTSRDSWRDTALIFRRWRQRPAFPAIVVLTLAFGVGANVAVYQIVEAVVLRRLPVAEPDRLVIVELADMTRWQGRRTTGYPVLSNPLWERIREERGPFDGALAWASTTFRLESAAGSAVARGLYMSGGAFDILGVTPLLGRTFTPDDDHAGCGTDGAVISHAFWQHAFGGDPSVVGRALVLDSRTVPILGVTPSGFVGLEVGAAFDVAVPICAQAHFGGQEQWLHDGNVWWLTVMGRVPYARSIESVDAELGTWSARLFDDTVPAGSSAEQIDAYRDLAPRASPGARGVSRLRAQYGDPLAALLAVTSLVLLLVCANLANLFLGRGSARQREFAVRRALGAPRSRFIMDLAIESTLLAAAGAAGGLWLASWMSRHLVGFLGPDVALELGVQLRAAMFVVGAVGVASLLFGLLPAWRAAGAGSERSMVAVREARGAGTSRGAALRRALVTSQVALSFVLLFGALVFTATLRNLLAVDAGFQADDVTVVRVDFRSVALADTERPALKRDLLERVRAVPGVLTAAEVRHVPLGGTGSSATVRSAADGPSTPIRLNAVTSDYLETMGMPLLAGPGFDVGQAPDASVAVITAVLASRLGLGADPIGRVLQIEDSDLRLEVVGVVADAKYFDLREEPVPTALVPKELLPDARSYTDFVVRTSLRSDALPGALTEALAAAAPGMHVEARQLEDSIERGLVRERLLSTLTVFFGILAAFVAAIGLYGVMANHVSQRRGENGVRIALGADRRHVLATVLVQAGVTHFTGIALGALMASAAAIPARELLFGIQAHSVQAYLTAATVLTGTAALASYLPARRATRTDPRQALSGE